LEAEPPRSYFVQEIFEGSETTHRQSGRQAEWLAFAKGKSAFFFDKKVSEN
jgi:hypothetical protein